MEQAFTERSNDVVFSLRHYTLAKQEVASSVRATKQLFETHGAREAAERCQALVVQLAEDLHSYALKRDALRRGLLRREEEYAWRHALVQLVGERADRGGAIIADQRTV